MIRDLKIWNRFEIEFLKKSGEDLQKKLCLLDEMTEHARQLGVWPPESPLDGLEVDFKIARVLNTNAN